MRITILGSSHMYALALGGGGDGRHSWSYKYLGDFSCGMGSRIVLPLEGKTDEGYLIPDLGEWLDIISEVDLLMLTISGSDWLNFCLSNRPEAFDFILPSRSNLPEIEGARIIPYAEIRETLRRHIRHVVLGIGLVADRVRVPVVYIEPPPPIKDNIHIAATSPWDKDGIDLYGVTSPWLRLKFFLLHSDLIAEACAAANVRFHRLPDTVRTAEGFMPEKCIADDALHAGPTFGQLMMIDFDREYA